MKAGKDKYLTEEDLWSLPVRPSLYSLRRRADRVHSRTIPLKRWDRSSSIIGRNDETPRKDKKENDPPSPALSSPLTEDLL